MYRLYSVSCEHVQGAIIAGMGHGHPGVSRLRSSGRGTLEARPSAAIATTAATQRNAILLKVSRGGPLPANDCRGSGTSLYLSPSNILSPKREQELGGGGLVAAHTDVEQRIESLWNSIPFCPVGSGADGAWAQSLQDCSSYVASVSFSVLCYRRRALPDAVTVGIYRSGRREIGTLSIFFIGFSFARYFR